MAKKTIGRVTDFYQFYGLNQKDSAKNIKKRLRQIQADIRTAMSDGSLNGEEILKTLQEDNEIVAQAMKCFKNDEAKKKYDAELEAAYKAGTVDVESQKLAKELFDEILRLFAKREYKQVIAKCIEQINNNTRDVRLYEYLAKSYRLLGDSTHAMDAVENGLNIESDNINLLKVACRISTADNKNYDKAQAYINRLNESNHSAGTVEQIYLYMNFDKKDIAYQTINEYLATNPNDQFFRQQCAYDFIGYANECYDLCEAEDGTKVSLILSGDAYNTCLEYTQKAYDLYQDENTKNELEYAKHFGEVEFNEDNKEDLNWDYKAIVFLGIFGLMGFITSPFAGIALLALCGVCAYVTISFRKISYRPYWQIYKYIFTGEREPEEQKFLMIGRIMSFLIRAFWWMFKWMFKWLWRNM